MKEEEPILWLLAAALMMWIYRWDVMCIHRFLGEVPMWPPPPSLPLSTVWLEFSLESSWLIFIINRGRLEDYIIPVIERLGLFIIKKGERDHWIMSLLCVSPPAGRNPAAVILLENCLMWTHMSRNNLNLVSKKKGDSNSIQLQVVWLSDDTII